MKNKKCIALLATLTIILGGASTVQAVRFYDTVGTRYEGAVERLGELGIIDGVGSKQFNYSKTVTRAELAKMIIELSGWEKDKNMILGVDDETYSFKDVKEDTWYYDYVMLASKLGYINGYEDNTFRPDKEVTYKEIAKIFTKALGHGYLVETDQRGWAAEYIDKFREIGLGKDAAYFEMDWPATRGNVAIMLWNTLITHVWEKVELNDYDGFTFVNSGRTLFDKWVKGYAIKQEATINGFKEQNGDLYVKLGNTYYKLYDQDSVITFSMIGGKGNALFRYMRYPEKTFGYELIGLTSDVGAKIEAGTFKQLKNEGISISQNATKVGTNPDFGYHLNMEDDALDRIVTVSGANRFFYVKKVNIANKDSKTIKDEELDLALIEKENDPEYEYVPQVRTFTKEITINDDYVIGDGAVLFRNNRRVDWSTLKEGEILTEIVKDKYYFVSNQSVEAVVKGYEKTASVITIKTENEEFESYKESKCLLYFAKEETTLNKVSKNDLLGKKVKLVLDFAGRVARVEVIENSEDDLLKLNIGFYKDAYYSTDYSDEECMLTVVSNKKEKEYDTVLKYIPAEHGDIVRFEFDEDNPRMVKTTKVLNGTVKLTDDLTFAKETYENLNKKIEYDNLAKEVLVCKATYYYDFGETEKISDFDVKTITIEDLKDFDEEKAEFFTIHDKDNRIRAIIVKDYSNKADTFYARVMKIYSADKDLRAVLDVFGRGKMDFKIQGSPDCEEGDLISFKLISKEIIETSEKFTTKALGYYKDIIVKDVRYNGFIAENGEIYWKDKKIVAGDKEYDLRKYVTILVTVAKDEEGNWTIARARQYEPEELQLKDNDRIAIDEIENTVIVYRGYKD